MAVSARLRAWARRAIVLALLGAAAPPVAAQPMTLRVSGAPLADPGSSCPEQAWVVSPYPGFERTDCAYSASETVHSANAHRDLTGRVYSTTYRLQVPVEPVAGAIYREATAAMGRIGARQVYDPKADDPSLTFVRETAAGEFWYIVDDEGDSYSLVTIEVGR